MDWVGESPDVDSRVVRNFDTEGTRVVRHTRIDIFSLLGIGYSNTIPSHFSAYPSGVGYGTYEIPSNGSESEDP